MNDSRIVQPLKTYLGKRAIDLSDDEVGLLAMDVSSAKAIDSLESLAKDLLGGMRRYKVSIFGDAAHTSLAYYLDQPHARNNTGKRNVGDLTYDEIGTLDRTDLLTVARALHGVLCMKEIELAQSQMAHALAERNYYSERFSVAERSLKIAKLRNTGVKCDGEP